MQPSCIRRWICITRRAASSPITIRWSSRWRPIFRRRRNQRMMRTRLRPDRRSAFLLGAVLVGTVAGGGALLYQQESQLADVVRQLRDKEKQRDDSARIASRLAETEL